MVIVGAGLSGIGAAHHLKNKCPGKSYVILEARDTSGGTWDLFRYPGVRSDSDMFTLGYRLRPWTGGKTIADGPSILQYLRDTAREQGIDRHIRYDHRVVRASWDSRTARWTVHIRTGSAERMITCAFLYSCTGYYSYEQGFTPTWPGMPEFRGRLVHPQHWPADLDCTGKRVIVIGSGATAVTLVPALAETAASVTMVQRSPSYVLSIPDQDPVGNALSKVLPARAAFGAVRWKNIVLGWSLYRLSRRRPALVSRWLRRDVRRRLPVGFDVDTHFTPSYDPWDQRLCLVPDGDLFRSLSSGRAAIVTDTIETFDPTGIRLRSGRHITADIVVTATGLNLLPFGGIDLVVDGEEVSLPRTLAYRGMMLSGVPNFAFAIGYTNASWTLKVDLVSDYLCRLLNHMDRNGYGSCVPVPGPGMEGRPLLDFRANYVLRSLESFPRQGSRDPWRMSMNYLRDAGSMPRTSVTVDMLFTPQPAGGDQVRKRSSRL